MSREGSLEAPTRHPLNWQNADFYNEQSLNIELERIFDICHGCRRCVSLCNSFPTLFDLVDESETMEVDGVAKVDYMQVVDQCYLCDLCYLTKCPYVPPHEWNLDFPHVMLRAKAVKFNRQKPGFRDTALSATDRVGSFAGIPVISEMVNTANNIPVVRKFMDKQLGIAEGAALPKFYSKSFRKSKSNHKSANAAVRAGKTTGKVAIFATCYGNRNEPQINLDLLTVFEHNKIQTRLVNKEKCCGMPKLELGDLEAVKEAKEFNIPILAKLIDQGWDIVGPIPSCVLMFKQELPLMFPEDSDVSKVQNAVYDPFEYLMLRHKQEKLNTNFSQSLGKIAYHAACHLRVQKIGLKTRDILSLIPDTDVDVIERCSGHDGTYAVKTEFHAFSKKICRPVVNRVKKAEANHYTSDCPMAGAMVANELDDKSSAIHPISLLRQAYGI